MRGSPELVVVSQALTERLVQYRVGDFYCCGASSYLDRAAMYHFLKLPCGPCRSHSDPDSARGFLGAWLQHHFPFVHSQLDFGFVRCFLELYGEGAPGSLHDFSDYQAWVRAQGTPDVHSGFEVFWSTSWLSALLFHRCLRSGGLYLLRQCFWGCPWAASLLLTGPPLQLQDAIVRFFSHSLR